MSLASAAAALATLARFFKLNLQRLVSHDFTVEPCNCGSRFVAFHFNEAEALALARKNVSCKFDRPNLAVLVEHFGDRLFRGLKR